MRIGGDLHSGFMFDRRTGRRDEDEVVGDSL